MPGYKGAQTQQQEKRNAARNRSKASAARIAALDVVSACRLRDAFAHELIEARLGASRLSAEDRAFATLLALGVTATKGTLDEVIDRALRSPDDIQPNVRDALEISTYEIIFLKKSPYAAVDQGVELVSSVAPRARGLANSVLRKIAKSASEFPFGDPRKDINAFARQFAFPTWLAARVVKELGPDAPAFLAACNEQAPLFVAVNAVRAQDEKMVALLEAAGAEVEPAGSGGIDVPGCYRLDSGRVLQDGRVRRAIEDGKLLVADASSQAVALLAVPDSPGSVLEIGAGRATKTILMQSNAYRRFGKQLPHTALDNRAFKTQVLLDRVRDYGISVEEALACDATKLDEAIPGKRFDAVFIDAPCSGLGTLRRHPEIRWRLDEKTIQRMSRTGAALLASAAPHVAPGGLLTFATCTITSAENDMAVAGFLKSPEGRDFEPESIGGYPHFAPKLAPGSPDAHFAVRLRRKASTYNHEAL